MSEEGNSEQKPQSQEEPEGIWCAKCGTEFTSVAAIIVTPNGAMPIVPFWCGGCNRPLAEIRMKVVQSPIARAATIPGNLKIGH